MTYDLTTFKDEHMDLLSEDERTPIAMEFFTGMRDQGLSLFKNDALLGIMGVRETRQFKYPLVAAVMTAAGRANGSRVTYYVKKGLPDLLALYPTICVAGEYDQKLYRWLTMVGFVPQGYADEAQTLLYMEATQGGV